MSREDFEQCTPLEFYEAWNRWVTWRRDAERSDWERTRVIAMYVVQPYVKGHIKASDILPFPWDEQPKEEKKEELSREELDRRYAAARKKYGLK